MRSTGEVRVLHVDDDPEFAEVTAMHLERVDEAISVATAATAADGLERLRSEPVDCIVSDHDVPETNGLEFLRAVRDEFPELPFIIFTGKGNEEIASDAISAGVTEYLQKDVGTDQYTVLSDRIRRAVAENRAKSAPEKSERQRSTLISNLPGMVYRARNEPGWPIEFVSSGAAELVGYDAETIESEAVTWRSLIDPEDCERIARKIETSVAAGEPYEVSYRIETDAAVTRWVTDRGRVVGTDDGVELVEGFITDITDRRERERELEQYRTLVQNVGDPMYVLDSEGVIQMANDAMVDHLGYERAEVLGERPEQFMPPEDVAAVTETLMELAETPAKTWETVEMRTVDANGHRTVNENKVATLQNGDGEFVGSVGVMRDVTERSQRQWELERYETIVEAVGDPVYALDEDGVFTFVNEAIEPMTAYSPDELVGEHIGRIMTDEDVARGDELIQELLANPETDSGTLEMDVVTERGERIPSENNLALLPSRDGEFTGTAGVIRDIHERKEREEQLTEFASVVSHDLRNPLNVVQGRLQLAQESGDVSHLDAAADAADRMEQLIEDLLTLARQGDTVGTLTTMDIGTAAEQAWANVETVAATLEVEGTETVEADPERFRELLENLFRNSIEHGSADSAGAAGPMNRRPTERGIAHSGLHVTVGTIADGDGTSGFYVADNGPGIDPDDRETVFERGYTSTTDGTGFGLAIVEDIATAHDWTGEITESENGGARFEFRTTRVDR